MKILVFGGRDYGDASLVHRKLEEFAPTTVVQGGCPTGADAFAREWATRKKVPCITYEANWRKYGRAAGPKRNQQMLDEENPDLALGFPGGRGTADMARRCKKCGIRLIECS